MNKKEWIKDGILYTLIDGELYTRNMNIKGAMTLIDGNIRRLVLFESPSRLDLNFEPNLRKLPIYVIEEAIKFAAHKHLNQRRKYTGEPYFLHCYEVANIVTWAAEYDENMIAAAFLHDVVEDCEVTIEDIQYQFGEDIATLVDELTDISTLCHGNRTVRKEIDRLHIAKASPRAKTIKLADCISNTSSIREYDPRFAKIYLAEKRELLKVLVDGDDHLFKLAYKCIMLD